MRALLAAVAACALILSAAVLPLFGAAAPAGEVAREVGTLAAGERANPSGGQDAARSPARRGGGGGGGGTGGGGGSAGGLGDFGLGQSGLLRGPDSATLFDVLSGLGGAGGGPGFGGGSGGGGSAGDGASGGASGGTAGPGASGGSGGGGLVEAFAQLFGGGGADGGSASPGTPSDPASTVESAGGQCVEAPPYEVCFPDAPVPGEETRLLVLRDGEPAEGVVVTFEGEAVGRTDTEGTVTATVPYVRRLSVGVRAPANAVRPVADRRYSLTQPDGGNASLPVDASLRLDVAGDPAPGETAAVRVTLGDRPVADALVTVDGERVGRTDERGRLPVPFPVAESATLRAERGDFAAERTVTLADVRVALSSGPLPVGLPGRSATVNVTDAGAPVANATVALGGDRVGRTATDGTVTTSLPLAPTVEVTVTTAAGLTVTRSKAVFVTPLVALFVLLGLLGGLGYLARQSEGTGRGLLEQLRVTLADLAADLLSALVGLASSVEATAVAVHDRLRETVAALFDADVDLAAFVRTRLSALRAVVLGLLARPGDRVREIRTRLGGGGGATATDAAPSGADTERGPHERIEAAWGRFVRRLGISRAGTRTPGQVAGEGIAAGYPPGPVRRLTDAFRTVEYSDADPGAHVDAAERAAAALSLDDTAEESAAAAEGSDEPAGSEAVGEETTDAGAGGERR